MGVDSDDGSKEVIALCDATRVETDVAAADEAAATISRASSLTVLCVCVGVCGWVVWIVGMVGRAPPPVVNDEEDNTLP